MFTYLLSWNPRRAQWKERTEILMDISNGLQPATSWGVISKQIEPGDRIYLIRLGDPPKGIFAFGAAVSASYMDSHWDKAKCLEGKQARFVDIMFIEMLDPEGDSILDLQQLQDPPLNEMHWTIQGSGVRIQEHIVSALDIKWRTHLQLISNNK